MQPENSPESLVAVIHTCSLLVNVYSIVLLLVLVLCIPSLIIALTLTIRDIIIRLLVR